jgi:hypothetical protein
MTKRQYILVAPSGFQSWKDQMCTNYSSWGPGPGQLVAKVLENGESLFLMGDSAVVLETEEAITPLTKRLRKGLFGDAMFFLADVTTTPRAGNMPQAYWELLDSRSAVQIGKPPSNQAA